MRFWFGCLLLAIAACKRQDDVELALDPGISLYALITLDPEGALLGSTPLGPSPEPRSFVTSPDFTNLIAGYDQADFGEAPLARLSGEPLEVATGCQARLPPPRFLRALANGRLDPADDVDLPALTTPSWKSSCPTIIPEIFVTSGLGPQCGESSCQTEVVALDRCRFQLDLTFCKSGKLEAQVDPFERLCVASSRDLSCTPEGATTRCGEGACALHFTPYTPNEPELFGAIDDVHLPGEVDPLDFGEFVTGSSFYNRGELRDLLPLSNELVVVQDPDHAMPHCDAPSSAKFVFVDQESAQIVRTVPADRCQAHLQRIEGGFLSTYVDQEIWQLGSYDELGNRQRSVSLLTPSVIPGGSADSVEILDLPTEGVILTLVVTNHERPDEVPDYAELAVVDRVSFMRLHVWSFPGHLLFMNAAEGSHVIISDPEVQKVTTVDFLTGAKVVDRLVRSNFKPDTTLMRGLYYEGQLLIPANESIYTLGQQQTPRQSIVHGRELNLIGLHLWPKQDHSPIFAIAVGPARAGGLRPTVGMFFDPGSGAIEPHTWSLADRGINRIRTDPSGRLWMLVPELLLVRRYTPN